MGRLQWMIKNWTNKVIDIIINSREGESHTLTYSPFFRRPNPLSKSFEPPLVNLKLNLYDVALENFNHFHQENILREHALNGNLSWIQ